MLNEEFKLGNHTQDIRLKNILKGFSRIVGSFYPGMLDNI